MQNMYGSRISEEVIISFLLIEKVLLGEKVCFFVPCYVTPENIVYFHHI